MIATILPKYVRQSCCTDVIMLREMSNSDEAQKKAAATYNAAADFFDHPANTFWERYGRRTIERLNLTAGERVLDVCCGSGASAIPAAQAVGPTGSVTGVDLAENLLELASGLRFWLKQVHRQLINPKTGGP